MSLHNNELLQIVYTLYSLLTTDNMPVPIPTVKPGTNGGSKLNVLLMYLEQNESRNSLFI